MTPSPRRIKHPATPIEELYGFRDQVTGMRLCFFTPSRRFDLWQDYVAGARRTYQRYHVENALRIPDTTSESSTPFFAVAIDDHDVVRAGWYTNGRLEAVSGAHAPSEFASEPYSAALVAEWIDSVLADGVMEMKGAWVDPESEQKSGLADLLARSYLHAMHVVGVPYAFGTAAEHATPRWAQSGAQSLPGIVLAAYPDARYRTTFLWWHVSGSPERCAPDQLALYLDERRQAGDDTRH
ncbi:hypothetical protein [Jiangella alkaliphila]|uniref:Uncharacterized protein n=1 Tax=Jiangella alkaliphila TaxID=419479 RepID=A0A1H2I529_9ACTN|nr:hypothetical protein [Jiangella alkaliphila]SDU39243.1 hypothetical protein SAMN04488563_1447 [Jiangella alkaliphila]